ncbi:MAG: uridine kinase [Butyrivibrio sp.]|nr:uridine kinase [Acetatifactor muris]MCM1559460.1 uridine kinase [Butyrivibrio sp.]
MQDRIERVLTALSGVSEDVKIIAIDGHCAAGKTTFAEQLAQAAGAGLIHMDDFFLPRELRTKERLNEPGGNIHYERFAEEVLPGLRFPAAFEYTCYDCKNKAYGESRRVPASMLRIVEGAYSCHPKFGDYMDIRIFCDIKALEQRARIKERDGADSLPIFMGKWIPWEEKYFAAYKIRERADIIL